VTRQTSFYYSFLVLPKRQRDVIVAVWDFCRAVDDAVDLEPDPSRARLALDGWRAEVARLFSRETPLSRQGATLQPFVAPFHLPREQFDALVDGVAMDVVPQRFATFAELEVYCHRVASSVGLICAEIFGYRDPAVVEYARDLGVALQLTNILRDVGVDLKQGRLYVPLDDLERCGVTEADIRQELEHAGHGVQSPRVRAVLEYQASRARIFFSRAVRVLPPREARAVLAAEIMRGVYSDLLRRIESAGFDVFSAVLRVPRSAQAVIAMRMWGKVQLGRSRRG
jgi:phytoene synthase